MDIAEIRILVKDGKIEYVKIGAPDIEGVYRGKRVAASHFPKRICCVLTPVNTSASQV